MTSGIRITTSDRALAVVIATLLAYGCALEVSMRVIFPTISNTQRRERADHAAAIEVKPVNDRGLRSALLIGNSLLHQGLDRNAFSKGPAGAMAVTPVPVEGTTYLDWYFGFRRLMAEGASPSVVILCINARHMVSNATNGDAFAHSMMRLLDLPSVADAAGLDATMQSAYLFAHLSAWLGGRENLRIGLLQRLMPNAQSLVRQFTVVDPTPFTATDETVDKAVSRLVQFRDLVQTVDADFVWLVPPTRSRYDPAPAIKLQAERQGIKVVMPFAPGEMPESGFSDGLHLGSTGAALFTTRAAEMVRSAIEERRMSS